MCNLITCGIFLIHNNDILICHPTGSSINNWSIPKGLNESYESPLVTAIRELKEETNISLFDFSDNIIMIGEKIYKTKRKKIIGFYSNCTKGKPNKFICNSITSKGFPEVDLISWYPISLAMNMIHEAQRRLFQDFY